MLVCLCEKLSRNPQFGRCKNVGPSTWRLLSMFYHIQWHKIAIIMLPSYEMVSGCYDSQGGVSIMWEHSTVLCCMYIASLVFCKSHFRWLTRTKVIVLWMNGCLWNVLFTTWKGREICAEYLWNTQRKIWSAEHIVYDMRSYIWKYIMYYHFISIFIDMLILVLMFCVLLIQYKKRYPAVTRFQRFGNSVQCPSA
jgi:hypothetical protein